MCIRDRQTTYAVIACDTGDGITGNGDGTFSITLALLAAGVEQDYSVGLLIDDLPVNIAKKAAAALNLEADLIPLMKFYADGINLYARCIEAAANDAAFNIKYADGTCAGLTTDATSEIGVGGVAEVEVAGVTNISGPGLGVDTEDVTTHDSTAAYEEVVATIIRSGEITLDIVYDPGLAIHAAATGLLYRLEDQIYSFFKLIFSDDTEWESSGYIIGFEPGSPVAGALTASVKAKITGQPLLA